jgi:hypothetical protein
MTYRQMSYLSTFAWGALCGVAMTFLFLITR